MQESLFSKAIEEMGDREFMEEFNLILRELDMDMVDIVKSTISKEEMTYEGRNGIISTEQLRSALGVTVHQLKES